MKCWRSPPYKRLDTRLLWALCSLLSVSSSLAAAAHEAAPPLVEDEIRVLGSRLPLAPNVTGGNVVFFSGSDLNTAQLPFVTELLRTVPSASVAQSGGSGTQAQLRLRGSEANHTLVLLDGFELNDPAAGSEYNFAHLRGSTIGSIELLPGPIGALWGSSALGGAIALSTPRPRRAGTDTRIRLEFGQQGTRAASGWLGHRGDDVEASLLWDHFSTDGTNIARTGSERDGHGANTLAFGGRFRLNQTLTLQTTFRNMDSKVETDPGDPPVDCAGQSTACNRASELALTLLGLRLEHKGTSSWSHALGFESLISDHDDIENSGERSGGRAGSRHRAFLRSTLDYAAGLPGTQRLTLLGELEYEGFEQDGTPNSFGDPNQKQALEHRSLLVEWNWKTLWGTHFSATARHDWNDTFEDALHYRLVVSSPLPARLGESWASWAKATQNPTFTERFGFSPSSFTGNPALRPESSRALEIGWQRSFSANLINTAIVWHRARLSDEINGFAFDPVTFISTAVNRSRSSRREGLEAQLTVNFDEYTTVTARYAWLDATEPARTGDKLVREIRRPRHAAGANFITRSAFIPLVFRVDASWVGERTDNVFPPPDFLPHKAILAAYQKVDVSISWQGERGLSLFARMENLLGENYEEVFGYTTPGRTLRVGLGYSGH